MPGSWMADLAELPDKYQGYNGDGTFYELGPFMWETMEPPRGLTMVCKVCGPVFTSLWNNEWTTDDWPAIKAHSDMPEHQALVALSPAIRM